MFQFDNAGAEEVVDMPIAREAVALNQTLGELAKTALRVKAQRDEAIKLLKETLLLREIGNRGPHKEAIRDFLRQVGAISEGA